MEPKNETALAVPKIFKAIPAIMAEVGAIEKGRKNTQQGYQFRGIDDAYFAFQPLFAKHGVFVVPTVLKTVREEREARSGGVLIYTSLEVKHTFYADDGSSVECVMIGEAMDSGDKSSNKAMSAAMKYALLEVFCVPTHADNDTENNSPEPAPRRFEDLPPQPPSKPAKAAPKSNGAQGGASEEIGARAEDMLLEDYTVEERKNKTTGKPYTLWTAKFKTDTGSEFTAGTIKANVVESLGMFKGEVCSIKYRASRYPGTYELLGIEKQKDELPM